MLIFDQTYPALYSDGSHRVLLVDRPGAVPQVYGHLLSVAADVFLLLRLCPPAECEFPSEAALLASPGIQPYEKGLREHEAKV